MVDQLRNPNINPCCLLAEEQKLEKQLYRVVTYYISSTYYISNLNVKRCISKFYHITIGMIRDYLKGKEENESQSLKYFFLKKCLYVSIQWSQQSLTLAVHTWVCSVYWNTSLIPQDREGEQFQYTQKTTDAAMINNQGQIRFPAESGEHGNRLSPPYYPCNRLRHFD